MTNKKKFYIVGLILVVLITIICSIYYKRDNIVKSYLQNKIEEVENQTHTEISLGSIKMDGLTLITLHDIIIANRKQDTIAKLETAKIHINPIKIFRGSRDIHLAEINNVKLHTSIKKGSRQDSTDVKDSTVTVKKPLLDKVRRLTNIYNSLTHRMPKNLSISEMNVTIEMDSSVFQMYLPEVKMSDRNFYTQILYKEETENIPQKDNGNKYCIIEGSLAKGTDENSHLKIYAIEDSLLSIPFLDNEYQTTIAFDTLDINVKLDKSLDNLIYLSGDMLCPHLDLFNSKIAANHIILENTALHYSSKIGEQSFELDSTSLIQLNKFKLHPYLSWSKQDTIQRLEFNLESPKDSAQHLFSSIPSGLCSHLKGIETEGELSYHLHIKLETDKIDSLEFESAMTPYDFNIKKFGDTDFREVAHPFEYKIYEDGNQIGSMIVGEENPNYVEMKAVTPYLIHSILFSEDGFFFSHKGFYDTAIRSSIIKNLKEKRFARGGSTISMQLVKNLWLSKEKTLSRKLEEAMIVWMIENKRLLSKDRMFDIYLNIIEWGPHIYGVRSASHFYFSKEPADLSIEEAIFMTSIIPKPKKFMWSFDANHNLKPYMADYFKLIGEKLLSHEIILEEEFNHIDINKVHLTGIASSFLKKGPVPTSAEEENETEEEYEIESKQLFDNINKNDENISDKPNKTN